MKIVLAVDTENCTIDCTVDDKAYQLMNFAVDKYCYDEDEGPVLSINMAEKLDENGMCVMKHYRANSKEMSCKSSEVTGPVQASFISKASISNLLNKILHN